MFASKGLLRVGFLTVLLVAIVVLSQPKLGGSAAGREKAAAIKPGTAIVKGRITLEGKPDLDKLNQEFLAILNKVAAPADKPHCLNVGDRKDQLQQQDWKVGPDNGLGEVFVYLRPPSVDHYFAVDPDDSRIRDIRKKGSALIDQPHCVFIPHVTCVLPSFRDLEGNEKKGVQKLEVLNSAKIGHNVKFPDGTNVPLAAGVGRLAREDLKPDYTPVTIGCAIHPWMYASILVLDHPYSAITNDKGEFEIKDAPEGKVRLIVWHFKLGFITDNKARGIEVELKNGETLERNFTPAYRQ